ncbi:MAG TPA: hypothetical protein VFA43_25255 [Gemmatimonadaceae bacterium]|nr:hypothetical protein [Gemmatimonadaceae bacterium]
MKKGPKKATTSPDDEMRDHYDFRGGVRGKHAAQFAAGTNVVRLDDDVAEVFHTPESVNAALRVLAQLVKAQAHKVPA